MAQMCSGCQRGGKGHNGEYAPRLQQIFMADLGGGELGEDFFPRLFNSDRRTLGEAGVGCTRAAGRCWVAGRNQAAGRC